MKIKFSNRYKRNKVIINTLQRNKTVSCEICGKEIKSNAAFVTHLLRKHGINFDDYIFKFYKNINPEFKYEQCGFCKNNAKPTINVDFVKKEFYLSYPDGYLCYTSQCINNICLTYFNLPYSQAKHKYEHIGANSDFLSHKLKMPIDEVKNTIKRDPNFKYNENQKTNLAGFIARYGKELGTQKYNERCKAISKSLTIDWFIEKYGIDDGVKKYEERINKCLNASSNITHSKHQFEIFNRLKAIDNNWESERYAGGVGIVDMINKSMHVVIEYFGDYWHCNPLKYKDDFFNKNLQISAKEKQRLDRIRLSKILNAKNVNLIIVIWENTFFKLGIDSIILKCLNEFKHIDLNKKRIIWI